MTHFELDGRVSGAGWGGECILASINVNGLRLPSKRDALAAFLLGFKIKICVATEPHPRQANTAGIAKYLLEYGYKIGADNRRHTGGVRIRGGVPTLARPG